ncbi:MAG: O-antigen ligase family protein [Patescibacteria group bacterium]
MKDVTFFGQTYRTTLIFILLAELASFFVYWMKFNFDLSWIFFIIISLLTLAVTIKNIKYGLYIALAELFIGSQGHLFEIKLGNFELSIRIGIFAIIMLVWLVYAIRHRQFAQLWRSLKEYPWLLALAIICLWGIIFALWRGNSLASVFLDFNAWIYFLYLLPMLTIFKKENLADILQIFSAGLTVLALKTLLFLYVLSHQFSFSVDFYKWGRDTLWGEFAIINENFYRIFSQGHVFILIGLTVFLSFLFFDNELKMNNLFSNRTVPLLATFFLVIVISLSRSFWLALALTLLLFFLLFIKQNRRKLLVLFSGSLIIAVSAIVIFSAIIYFPWPKTSGQFDPNSLLEDRLSPVGAGISSRWSQLPNLTNEIIKHPILGSGWGTTVTYQSTDPRILTETNPQGWYTTYAFEWGYLDIILKIGLLGLIVYLSFIWSIIKTYWQFFKKNTEHDERALTIGFLLGLFALIITHGFSPYLNHPLGIGYLLLVLVFIRIINQEESQQISDNH